LGQKQASQHCCSAEKSRSIDGAIRAARSPQKRRTKIRAKKNPQRTGDFFSLDSARAFQLD
jgi:hypothetical protein